MVFQAIVAAVGIGAAVGGTLQANSSKNIKQACEDYENAKQELKDKTALWGTLIKDLNKNYEEAKDFGTGLKRDEIKYKNKLKAIKDVFVQEEINTVITVATFIASIVIGFILRYFRVYENIWKLIVN